MEIRASERVRARYRPPPSVGDNSCDEMDEMVKLIGFGEGVGDGGEA